MKVTKELLEKYQACKEGLEFLDKFYPDGAEVLQIVKEHEISSEMLHFARRYFSLNEEELAKYFELCKVRKGCKYIWDSTKIENSSYIYNSNNVLNSKYVRGSLNIYDSTDIYESDNVQDCENIFNSKNVENSQLVMLSNDIEYSSNIFNSANISWSKMILHSSEIEESNYIYGSQFLQNCHFSGFLKHCNNCLFCYGLKDADTFIFNQPVTFNEFEYWKEKLIGILNLENEEFIQIKENVHDSERFSVNTKLNSLFNSLSKDFFGWISTVLNYNEDLFLDLFFLKN